MKNVGCSDIDPGGRLGPVVVVVQPDAQDARRVRYRQVERDVARGMLGAASAAASASRRGRRRSRSATPAQRPAAARSWSVVAPDGAEEVWPPYWP